MPTMSHLRQTVRGGVHLADDGGGPFLKGKATGEGPVPGLQDRTGGWIHGGTPSEPDWMGTGPPAGGRPAAARGLMDVPGLLTEDCGFSGMPSRGLQGGWGWGGGLDPTYGIPLYIAKCGIRL